VSILAIKGWDEHTPDERLDLENEVFNIMLEYGKPLNVSGFLLLTSTFLVDGFTEIITEAFKSLKSKGRLVYIDTHNPDWDSMMVAVNS
jgi:hypothetical protein